MCLGAPKVIPPAQQTASRPLPLLPPPPPSPAATTIQEASASAVGKPDPNNPEETIQANRVGRNSLRIPLIT